ncbi:hypothetical protein, partial [Streptococcus pneumoniae]|uniref:hypothetical protein n=1 Tax=Streptococcus pneumoniae TaxID=1313 RepID=UPI000B1F91A7
SKIGLTTTLKNAWTTSRQVNFFWVANFNLKFGFNLSLSTFSINSGSFLEVSVLKRFYTVLKFEV